MDSGASTALMEGEEEEEVGVNKTSQQKLVLGLFTSLV
jgi:hypothetical protein